MEEAPWASHRWWTLPRAVAEIVERFPDLRDIPARYLGEGFDFQVFLVGEWVFKFPKRDDYAQSLETERRLLDRVSPGCPLPVPLYERTFTTEQCDMVGGYRILPGEAGIDFEPGFQPAEGEAEQFAAFLAHVHSVDADEMARCGLHPRQEPTEDEWYADLDRYVRSVSSRLPPVLAEGAAEWVTERRLRPFGYDGPPRVCHRDLAADHILIAPGPRRVTGVIDWSDAGLGDPAGDFAGIYAWLGRGFAERVLASYTPATDDDLLTRAQAQAFNWIMGSLEYGLLGDRPNHWRLCSDCLRRFLADEWGASARYI